MDRIVYAALLDLESGELTAKGGIMQGKEGRPHPCQCIKNGRAGQCLMPLDALR